MIISGILLAVSLVSCGPDTNTIRRMQAIEEGVDSPTSIEELTEAIKKYQHRVEDILNADIRTGLWYKILASRYMDNKLYGKALENYRQAIEFYPTNQNLFYYTGICAAYMAKASLDFDATGSTLERDGYYSLAESAYLRAIELQGDYIRALYALAVLYIFEFNTPNKAIPFLETLLAKENQNIDAMFLLARAYYSENSFDEAIKLYDRIISITKDTKKKAEAEANKSVVLEQSYGKD